MSSTLLHHWVVAGIVSASSRFIPIPFVDDVVKDQCRRYIVSQTLAAHDTELTTHDLKPFYDSGSGCLAGCMGALIKAPLKLPAVPGSKNHLHRDVGSWRSARSDANACLMGRTLDRYLSQQVKIVATPDYLAKMRKAFKVTSFKRMDLRIVRAGIADALTGIGGWKSGAMKSAESGGRAKRR